ncbi:hypothetical protein B0H14DRAFT_3640878 [Mycena olivaceomarginata]|nr:hypothetical protein B0H14DRAFT_3640878 [Mycena olivaceomarginata]
MFLIALGHMRPASWAPYCPSIQAIPAPRAPIPRRAARTRTAASARHRHRASTAANPIPTSHENEGKNGTKEEHVDADMDTGADVGTASSMSLQSPSRASSRRSPESFRTMRASWSPHVDVGFTATMISPARDEGAEEDTGREEGQPDKRKEEDRVCLRARQHQRRMPDSVPTRTAHPHSQSNHSRSRCCAGLARTSWSAAHDPDPPRIHTRAPHSHAAVLDTHTRVAISAPAATAGADPVSGSEESLRRPRGAYAFCGGGGWVLQCFQRRLHMMWPGVLCVRLGLWLGVGRRRVVVVYMGRVRLREVARPLSGCDCMGRRWGLREYPAPRPLSRGDDMLGPALY